MSPDRITEVLKSVIDPNTGKDLVAARAAKNIKVEHGDVSLDIELGYPAKSQFDPIRRMVIDAIKAAGAGNVSVNMSSKVVAHAVQRGLKVMPNVKNIVAVSSGKGGVGKSTVAANLALALVAEGARVGVLDADIYGPSQPTMLGITGKPEMVEGPPPMLAPMENHGLQVASIGFLVEPDQPMVWRGPMVTQALQQLLAQTAWNELDYLIVDMPPGTGDIQLTLAQQVPVTGAVIVTTPQDIALADAIKGLKMFEKVSVPILGLVENMAVHVCSKCGHAEHIFGSGGAQRMVAQHGVELLGSLPLDIRIREQADSGTPTVVAEPDGEIAAMYKAIARKVAIRIAEKARDMSLKMPVIKVSNT